MTSRPAILQVARAESLFASDLSAQTQPTRAVVEAVIKHAVRRYGGIRGCLEHLNAAHGDHPDTAALHMLWAREASADAPSARAAFGSSFGVPGRATPSFYAAFAVELIPHVVLSRNVVADLLSPLVDGLLLRQLAGRGSPTARRSIDGQIRLIPRRGYGFRNLDALTAAIYLRLGGISLTGCLSW